MKYFDNTRIATYKKCPRKFYFRHRRHFTTSGVSAALAFGSSWHEGMDVIWSLYTKDNTEPDPRHAVTLAHMAFVEKWQEEGMPDHNDMTAMSSLGARTPGNAMEMLWNYIEQRKTFMSQCTLIACERPFAVPIYPDNTEIFYIGRLDKVVRYEDRILCIEHKTTSMYSKDYGIRQLYLDTYSPNAQIDGYLHAIHTLYGQDAKAVWVDIALVHKQNHDVFKFLPIEKQFTMIDVWLDETQQWIERIMKDDWALSKESPDASIMHAFPKNDAACFDFGSMCIYRDLCAYCPNPIGIECPQNFIEKKWEPFSVLKLEKIGLSREE